MLKGAAVPFPPPWLRACITLIFLICLILGLFKWYEIIFHSHEQVLRPQNSYLKAWLLIGVCLLVDSLPHGNTIRIFMCSKVIIATTARTKQNTPYYITTYVHCGCIYVCDWTLYQRTVVSYATICCLLKPSLSA